jgi:hypothetical protein
MKDDSRYNVADCFETFPFPDGSGIPQPVEAIGQTYYDHRSTLMIDRKEGMTKTYNRFHNSDERAADIMCLRELHAEMDRTVLRAYGWHDLAAKAEPVFLDETNEDDHAYQERLFWPSDFRDEVLARLLELNAKRHDEEVRLGLASGVRRSARQDEDAEVEDVN